MKINAKSGNGIDNTPINVLDIHRYLGTWYDMTIGLNVDSLAYYFPS